MTSFSAGGNAYDDHGDGDVTFLFLPGWCGPRTYFRALADRLSAEHRTLTIDWRGHGESKPATGDFGVADLVDDAVSIIEESGARRVVPVAAAHAGWVAIELRRRLGADLVPGTVFLDWMVLGAPEPFLGALSSMADRATTRAVVDGLTGMWLADVELPALSTYVASMAESDDEMWARAAREIAGQFERNGAPLENLAKLDPAPPTLHLYAQPGDPAFLEAQQAFAAAHPWFQVEKLDAVSKLPDLRGPRRHRHPPGPLRRPALRPTPSPAAASTSSAARRQRGVSTRRECPIWRPRVHRRTSSWAGEQSARFEHGRDLRG